jgi:hypothetical protein
MNSLTFPVGSRLPNEINLKLKNKCDLVPVLQYFHSFDWHCKLHTNTQYIFVSYLPRVNIPIVVHLLVINFCGKVNQHAFVF